MKIFGKIVLVLGFLICGVSKSNHVSSNHNNRRGLTGRKLLTDWCSLACGPEKTRNIACEMNGNCQPQGPCKLESIDKKKILDAHNKLRNKFAAGKEPRANGFQASNMMALDWDDDLAFTASCNLAKCGGMEHDQCHTTPKFSKHVGQNLWSYMLSTTGADCIGKSIGGVQQWYDEVNLINLARIKQDAQSFQFDSSTGHFTQVIWAETTHVGCALTKNEDGGQTKCLMACNYGPGGNMIGGRMVSKGKPCSKCPKGLKCSSHYAALCGEGGGGGRGGGSNADQPSNVGLLLHFVLLVHTIYIFVK